jgi:hypothetical protein
MRLSDLSVASFSSMPSLIFIGYSELYACLEGTVTLAGTATAMSSDLAQLCQLRRTRLHKEPRAHGLAGFADNPATVAADEHRTAGSLRSGVTV